MNYHKFISSSLSPDKLQFRFMGMEKMDSCLLGKSTIPCWLLFFLQLNLLLYHLPHTECFQLSAFDVYDDEYPSSLLNRSSFPAGFIFGASSSAYQYEGAAFVDGKGISNWDVFVREQPEKILDHSTGDVAAEFYSRYKEDVNLMKEIGLDAFRFSIAWSRVIPRGKIGKGINQLGVDFYNNLIDELLLNGIEPQVTLMHWDLPQSLEDEYGGFLSSKIVDDFRDYADFCFKQFGDRVKNWITVNEPNSIASKGYEQGTNTPGRCSSYVGNCTDGNSATEPYIVMHNILLSHAAASNVYRQKYKASQKGMLGMSISTRWYVPKYPTTACRKAASRALDFGFSWMARPVVHGDYPESMKALVGDRLPKFTEEEKQMMKGSVDFLGVNYYSAYYAEDVAYSSINPSYTTDSLVNITMYKNGIPIGEPTACDWLYIYPEGLLEILVYVKNEYNVPVFLTENGVADLTNNSLPLNDALDDKLRIKFHFLHIKFLLESVKAGVDVRGYTLWSLLDNFEWELGYTVRFGITFIDFQNDLKRYPKRSALWFRNFLQKQQNANSAATALLNPDM
ncbi:Beta-glucosidase 17 [Linum perenne]